MPRNNNVCHSDPYVTLMPEDSLGNIGSHGDHVKIDNYLKHIDISFCGLLPWFALLDFSSLRVLCFTKALPDLIIGFFSSGIIIPRRFTFP